jgi:hypothetical protein
LGIYCRQSLPGESFCLCCRWLCASVCCRRSRCSSSDLFCLCCRRASVSACLLSLCSSTACSSRLLLDSPSCFFYFFLFFTVPIISASDTELRFSASRCIALRRRCVRVLFFLFLPGQALQISASLLAAMLSSLGQRLVAGLWFPMSTDDGDSENRRASSSAWY